jgi:hypothetical protein
MSHRAEARHERARRRRERLDPVRWGRPQRAALLRMVLAAVLLLTSAAVLWYQPPPPDQSGSGTPAAPGQDRPTSPGPSQPGNPGSARAGNGAQAGDPGPAQADPAQAGDPGSARGGRPTAPGTGDSTTAGPASPGGGIPADKVGVPVRLADPTALTLVRPGQRVDLLRPGDNSRPVATAALVLEVTSANDPAVGGLLLALSRAEAEATIAAATSGFAILIRPG